MNTPMPTVEDSLLIVIDVQERLLPVIYEHETVLDNINTLIRGAEILNLETIITEQYPKGLGRTVSRLERRENLKVFEKDSFSCLLDTGVLEYVQQSLKKNLILCGIESHICVLKTTLDALNQGFKVHLVADAVSSRTLANKQLALDRIQQAGGYLVSVEMILFMLMERAGNDTFRAISKLIK